MSSFEFDFDANELKKSLKSGADIHADVVKIIRHHGGELQRLMMRKAEFKKGYQTGATKRSITIQSMVVSQHEASVTVGPTTYYSPYLEYGTRYMEAQPFIGPALREQEPKFKNDINRLIKSKLR